MKEVAEERFVVFPRDHKTAMHGHVMEVWARAGLTPRVALEAENAFSILALVSAGFGNAILPSLLAGIHVPNVVWKTIDMDERCTESAIVMLYRDDGPNQKAQSRYVEYIRRFSAAADDEPMSQLAPGA